MSDDILKKAQALLGTDQPKGYLPGRTGATAIESARRALDMKTGLDVYALFDTTGSMAQYLYAVRADLRLITDALLKDEKHLRLSMNGVGDHCDGTNWLQMYALSSDPIEVQRSLDSIVSTHGGDVPEAYECAALALAQRLPKDSAGRKRAVVLIADSVPHGMIDAECTQGEGYGRSFAALKTLCDGFYVVGCDDSFYRLQEQLIDPARPDKEQFIPLGQMYDLLPQLLIGLAKKTDSPRALSEYLRKLELEDKGIAQQIRGLLGTGK